MSANVSWHCDHEGCGTWAKVGRMTEDWIVVYPGQDEPKHFCDGDHAMRWFATWAEPSVEVPINPEDYGLHD
jgi:hypothetical protein